MYKRLIQSTLIFGMLAAAPPVVAGTVPCGPRAGFVEYLEERYGETRQAMGLQGNRSIYELWSSDETGTWSLLVTNAQGQTCAIASGNNWQEVPGTKQKDPAT